jgi:hypothetical protein
VRWCYGGRWWSCDGEEGEEGELELHGRRTVRGGGRATLTVENLATARLGSGGRDDGCQGGARRGREAGGTSEAVGAARREAIGGCAGERREGVVGTRRRPDSALSRAVGAARGGHAATARCRAGPVRRATADKRDPLVSDFRTKNYPEGNYLKTNSWGLRKILEKFMEVGN